MAAISVAMEPAGPDRNSCSRRCGVPICSHMLNPLVQAAFPDKDAPPHQVIAAALPEGGTGSIQTIPITRDDGSQAGSNQSGSA